MVSMLNHTMALLRLLRWPNLLIVAASQVLVRQCILVPLLKKAHMEPQLPTGLFILLVLATVLITAGGYAINDYFDRKLDRVNKPQSLIVGRLIYPRHAMAYHLFFSIMGVILGSWVAFRSGQLYLSLVFFMVSGMLWFYSTTYKRELLLGNVIVALMTALVPFLVLLFELPLLARHYGSDVNPLTKYLLIWVLGFSLFAFLLNLPREIVKDAEDFEGDEAYGKRTIPVAWGMPAARWITAAFIVLTIVLLLLAWILFIPDSITLLYFLFGLIIPLLYVLFVLFRYRDKNSWHRASSVLKLVMLAGLGYMVVVNLVIRSMS
ncbi:MAG: geranylgeranylglycerol-phosphate geranylgeranyltransferase [Bacteroidales bacterium]|nr:geranylgeranylglycerol-phosphate geranylgeranyltransferase [Bacteroidales bacterium]